MKILLKRGLDAARLFDLLKCEQDAVFLDSAMKDQRQGRYSVIMFRPFARVSLAGDKLFYDELNTHSPYMRWHIEIQKYIQTKAEILNKKPIEILSQIESICGVRSYKESVPCEFGAMAGYISYDYARRIEILPEIAKNDLDVPHFIFGLYDFSLVTDHRDEGLYFCFPENRNVVEYHGVLTLVKKRIKSLTCKYDDAKELDTRSFSCARPRSDYTSSSYGEMVQKAREYIRNGDIFQVNLSQRFSAKYQGNPYLMYLQLRQKCPASFYAYLAFEKFQIASTSPERFFEIDGDQIVTRPIKGTRPRGRTEDETQKFCEELVNSEKDAAELMMIVDLMRNDLGKICEFGSVKVACLSEVEHYANVLHMVSTICGKMTQEVSIGDVLTALFPGGSITGAPKIRAMEIIDECEPVRRAVYTGAIGYIDFGGRADFNIAIRTLVCMSGTLYYYVGGGIVWDSDPFDEFSETMDKGRSIASVLSDFEDV